MAVKVEHSVYDHAGNLIGTAPTYGAARAMQQAALPADLQEAYAGMSVEHTPLFYADSLTPELCRKYNLLDYAE